MDLLYGLFKNNFCAWRVTATAVKTLNGGGDTICSSIIKLVLPIYKQIV